jgi:hypothetical protein
MAHILKNRFYVGEFVYRGEVHRGEHAPIVDRAVFDAVQARLRDRAVIRKLSRSRSPSFLSGLLFDDRGNHMSPSHANKRGVRSKTRSNVISDFSPRLPSCPRSSLKAS